MRCPRCKNENISKHNKRGIQKLLKHLSPTTSYRCIGCGFNFDRFNVSFLIVIILAFVGAAGGWMILAKYTMPQKTTPRKTISKSTPQPAPASNNEIKTIPHKPKQIDSTAKTASPETADLKDAKSEIKPPPVLKETEPPVKAVSENTIPEPAKPTHSVGNKSKTIKEQTLSKNETEKTITENKPETDRAPLTQTASPADKQTKTPAVVENGDQIISNQKTTQIETLRTDFKKLIAIKVQIVNGENQILIKTNQQNLDYKYSFLDYPPRMVIDFLGNWEQPKSFTQNMKNDYVSRIRLWKHDNKLRIVCDLIENKDVTPIFKNVDQGLLVIFK